MFPQFAEQLHYIFCWLYAYTGTQFLALSFSSSSLCPSPHSLGAAHSEWKQLSCSLSEVLLFGVFMTLSSLKEERFLLWIEFQLFILFRYKMNRSHMLTASYQHFISHHLSLSSWALCGNLIAGQLRPFPNFVHLSFFLCLLSQISYHHFEEQMCRSSHMRFFVNQ